MAEGTYEHACMRAELLGLERPDREEWTRHNPQPAMAAENEESAQFEEIELQNEELQNVRGGLTELNSILAGTQKKLNRIKGVCGSLTDLLKNKLGGSKDNMSYSTDPSYIVESNPTESGGIQAVNATAEASQEAGTVLHQQISSQVDKLDILLNKAENAQYSMQEQNKMMKRFLK